MRKIHGWMSAREAQHVLGITYSALRNLVSAGQIRSIKPPASRQSLYSSEDVFKIKHEFDMFENKKEQQVVFETARGEEDLLECIQINRLLFREASNTTTDERLLEKWKKWYQKNKEIFHVLRRGEEVVGIAVILPTEPESAVLKAALNDNVSFVLGDVNISESDLVEYNEGSRIDLYIMEIGVKPLTKTVRRVLGSRIITGLIDHIVDLGRRGIEIKKIRSVGASKAGARLLRHFGFQEVQIYSDGTRLFELDVSKSINSMIMSYKTALDNWRKHQSS